MVIAICNLCCLWLWNTESKIVVHQGITQFLLFLEPETGLAFSTGATLEFNLRETNSHFDNSAVMVMYPKLQITKSKSPQSEIQKPEVWPLLPESLKNNFLAKTD